MPERHYADIPGWTRMERGGNRGTPGFVRQTPTDAPAFAQSVMLARTGDRSALPRLALLSSGWRLLVRPSRSLDKQSNSPGLGIGI